MTDPQPTNPPSIIDAYLKRFAKHNPHVKMRTEGETLIIEAPWGAGNVSLSCGLSDHDFLSDLNNVWFNPAFDAVIHLDTNTIELLFLFLDPKDETSASYLDRSFKIHFDGSEYDCRFAQPSQRFMEIARRTQNVPSDDPGQTVPQLPAFRDFQHLDEIPERNRKYFANRVPRNFYISSTTDVTKIDLIRLAHHLNFISDYYDRRAPEINIRERAVDDTQDEKWSPRRLLNDSFPSVLSIRPVDDVVLQLLHVARRAPARQAFIYYYQVLEYAGHYFVDEKARSQLRKFLRDPALITCDDRKIGELFSMLTDVNHNDDVKMRKVIEDVVDPLAVWQEIDHDREFFTLELRFDGGFTLPPLIAKDTSATSWATMWMPKLFDQFTRIRNCLVHARERRENRVILPTHRNNRRIARYEPVIARVAQQIAIASRE